MTTQKTPAELLSEAYNKAMSIVGLNDKSVTELTQSEQELLNLVIHFSEQAKAVLTVLITSIVYREELLTASILHHL
jgi:hypothetical protein